MIPRTPTMTASSFPRWGYERRDSTNWDYSSVRLNISSLNQHDIKSGELHLFGLLSLLAKSAVPVPWYLDGNAIALWNSAIEWSTCLYTNGILPHTPKYSDEYHGIMIVNAENTWYKKHGIIIFLIFMMVSYIHIDLILTTQN